MSSKLAVFIDSENLTHWIKTEGIDTLMRELSTVGQAIVRRAYGRWAHGCLSEVHQGIMTRWGFELIHNFHPVSGKNSADIQMIVDVMEYVWRVKEIEWYVLATGDSDFSPLFRRLRELGKEVIGVGPRSPLSEIVKSSCSRYIYTDLATRQAAAVPQPDLDDAAELALQVLRTFDGPVNCSLLKDSMRNIDSAFNEKPLGFSSFTGFLKTIESIQVRFDPTLKTWFAGLVTHSLPVETPSIASIPILSDSIASVPASLVSPVEQYQLGLRNRNWKAITRVQFRKAVEILSATEPMDRHQLVEILIQRGGDVLTASDARKAINIFFKARVMMRTDKSTAPGIDFQESTWRLQKLSPREFLRRVDLAMLLRLVTVADEQGIKLDHNAVRSLLMNDAADVNHVSNLLKSARRYRREHARAGMDDRDFIPESVIISGI